MDWCKLPSESGHETYRRMIAGRLFEVTKLPEWHAWAVDYSCPGNAAYPWRVLGRPRFETKEQAFHEAEQIAQFCPISTVRPKKR